MAAPTGESTRRTPSSLIPEQLRAARDLRRRGHESITDEPSPLGRGSARKDRDRLFYAEGFHRLSGVTQIMSPSPRAARTHNRLTHSLKVAHVARSIAERLLKRTDNDEGLHARILELGGLDADVAEAAGLAHDLGHPPFGHIAEAELDRLVLSDSESAFGRSGNDGFEGNAQSFRIATRTEPYKEKGRGLSLTAATRAAIVKYPWARSHHAPKDADLHEKRLATDRVYRFRWTKFGYYETESDEFELARAWVPQAIHDTDSQTLEASIMDVADDITYAIHDLEDYYKAGLIDTAAVLDALEGSLLDGVAEGNPIKSTEIDLADKYPDFYSAVVFAEALAAIHTDCSILFAQPYDGGYERSQILRQFVSRQLGQLVNNVEVVSEPVGDVGAHVRLEGMAWHHVQICKAVARNFIIGRRDVGMIQRAQVTIIADLARELWAWQDEENGRLPFRLADSLMEPEMPRSRAVLDFICTLTDAQASRMHSMLCRGVVPDIFESAWL